MRTRTAPHRWQVSKHWGAGGRGAAAAGPSLADQLSDKGCRHQLLLEALAAAGVLDGLPAELLAGLLQDGEKLAAVGAVLQVGAGLPGAGLPGMSVLACRPVGCLPLDDAAGPSGVCSAAGWLLPAGPGRARALTLPCPCPLLPCRPRRTCCRRIWAAWARRAAWRRCRRPPPTPAAGRRWCRAAQRRWAAVLPLPRVPAAPLCPALQLRQLQTLACVPQPSFLHRPQPFASHTATQPHSHTATQPHSHTATQPHSHTSHTSRPATLATQLPRPLPAADHHLCGPAVPHRRRARAHLVRRVVPGRRRALLQQAHRWAARLEQGQRGARSAVQGARPCARHAAAGTPLHQRPTLPRHRAPSPPTAPCRVPCSRGGGAAGHRPRRRADDRRAPAERVCGGGGAAAAAAAGGAAAHAGGRHRRGARQALGGRRRIPRRGCAGAGAAAAARLALRRARQVRWRWGRAGWRRTLLWCPGSCAALSCAAWGARVGLMLQSSRQVCAWAWTADDRLPLRLCRACWQSLCQALAHLVRLTSGAERYNCAVSLLQAAGGRPGAGCSPLAHTSLGMQALPPACSPASAGPAAPRAAS